MTKEQINVFNTNDWDKCVDLLKSCWNTNYGTILINKNKSGPITIELTTGGWSENEKIIDEITGTLFWFLWWQESKRGGYYKFVLVNKINYEEKENKNGD